MIIDLTVAKTSHVGMKWIGSKLLKEKLVVFIQHINL
jgi:hypothetical protein